MGQRSIVLGVTAAVLALVVACKKGPTGAEPGQGKVPRPLDSAELQRADRQLASRSMAERLAALEALVTSQAPDAVEPLLRALRSENRVEQRLAVLGLGLLQADRALAPLVGLAETSTDPAVLEDLAWALGQFRARHAREPLVALLERKVDGSHDHTKHVVASLAAFGTPEATQELLKNHARSLSFLSGPLTSENLEREELRDSDFAEVLAARRECDGIGTILRWSTVPPPAWAPGHVVTCESLERLPQGCGAALRRELERDTSFVGLLEGYATAPDVELLRKLGKAGPERRRASTVLSSLGTPASVDAVPEGVLELASPLEPEWPNRLWQQSSRGAPERELANVRREAVETRAFQPVLRHLTGSGASARYQLASDIPLTQLSALALGRQVGKREYTGDDEFITLLGLADPNGAQALGELLEKTRASKNHEAVGLHASVALALFELASPALVDLSRSATPVIKVEALWNLAWRGDAASEARIREVLDGSDPVAQVAVVEANASLKLGRPTADFAPLLKSANADVLDAAFRSLTIDGQASDAGAFDLSAHEVALAPRADAASVLAALDPGSAERSILAGLADPDAATRAKAEKWLQGRLYSAGKRVRNRLILRAIGDPEVGPARGSLLTAAPLLEGEPVWELLHRPEMDAERRAFEAALATPAPELRNATAQALARLVASYHPEPALQALVCAHASPVIALLAPAAPSEPFGDAGRRQVLARGLVLWCGHDPKLAVELTRALIAAERPGELAYLLRRQPSQAVVDVVLDSLPKLSDSTNTVKALASVLSSDRLPSVLSRAKRASTELKATYAELLSLAELPETVAAAPALHEPLRALLAETGTGDDYPSRQLRVWAARTAARSKDPFYEPALRELVGRAPTDSVVEEARRALDVERYYTEELAKPTETGNLRWLAGLPPKAWKLPVGLALGAIFGRRYETTSALADLIVARPEPELTTLLPRLQHTPDGSLDWFRVAEARQLTLPIDAVLQALASTQRGVPLEAARYLTHAHDTKHWLSALSTLCENESTVQVALDTQGYSIEELGQASGADRAQTRACALQVLARRENADLAPFLLTASRDASPLVRQTAMQLGLRRPHPELAARALALLVAGDRATLRPWELAVWLKNNPQAASRFHAVGPLLRGSLRLPRVFARDVDECSYWLPLAAVRDPVAEAQYLSFVFDRGNPGPDKACELKLWLPIAWSGDQFVEHYERAQRIDQELLLDALLDSQLPLDPSYARALDRVAVDVLHFHEPGSALVSKLVDRLLDLPKAQRKALFEKHFRGEPQRTDWRSPLKRVRALL